MKRGFTLIELLMAVTILGLVMVAVTQLLASVLSGSGKSSTAQAVKENGQFVLSTIEKTARRAKSVTTCTTGAAGTLTVVVPESGVDTTYIFGLSGSQLTRTVTPPGGATNLTDPNIEVTAFGCTLTSATTAAPAVVSISMTLRKLGAADQSANAQTFTSSISLRTY